jgi:hypothetical protein
VLRYHMSFHPEVDIPPDARTGWELGPTVSHHNLARCPLFDDDAIIELLDRTPKENLFALHMGEDPELNHENRLALHDGLSGNALFRAVQHGRLWLNVTRIGLFADQHNELVESLYDQLRQQIPHFNPTVTTITLLVSSPSALVYYHVDGPASLLWHIRGDKRLWVYPTDEHFISQPDLEDIFAGAAHEYLPYRHEFDHAAMYSELMPGMLASWPPNSPHRITNGSSLCVSLSTEHFTPEHRRKARVYKANRLLRLTLGMHDLSTRPSGPASLVKQALGGLLARTRPARGSNKRHIPALRVDPDAPGGVRPL